MKRLSKAHQRRMIEEFVKRGWHNSPSGLTGQIVIEWCHAHLRPYRVDVVPTIGCQIWLLDHAGVLPTLPDDLKRILELAPKPLK